MKTEKTSFVPYVVDVITAETEKFFSENFSNDIEIDYLSGKQSGLTASLFSACAFRCPAADGQSAAAASKRAAAAAGYLSTQPHLAACGRAKAENGYINFYFSDEFIHAAIEYYSEQFDILYENGEFARYLYGNKSPACGIRRYCINRIISVCEMFAGQSSPILKYADGFNDKKQKALAEHCVFSLGKMNIAAEKAKRNSEFAAQLFYESDSCIKSASMIYLKLYKTCAYVLHTLITEEGKN